MVASLLRIFSIWILLCGSAYAYSPPPNCTTSGYGLNYATATNTYGCVNFATGGTVTLGTSTFSTNPQRSSQAGTGLFSTTSNTVSIAGASTDVADFLGVSSGVNNVIFTNAISGSTPSLNATGSDTNVSVTLGGQGAGYAVANGNNAYTRNNSPSFLPNFAKCIGNVQTQQSSCIILVGLDSQTVGFGAIGGGGSSPAINTTDSLYSWWVDIARYLNDQQGIPTSWQGQMGTGLNSYDYITLADYRITAGSGWGQSSTLGMGGLTWNATGSSTSGTLAFTTNQPVDTFGYCYYSQSSGGTFSVQIDSGSATNVNTNATAAAHCATIGPASSAGIHTLNIKAVSGGNIQVVGFYGYNSKVKQLIFISGAGGGDSIADWNGSAPNGNSVLTALAPALTIIKTNLNEAFAGMSQSTYNTDMTATINAAKQSGAGDVLLISDDGGNPANGDPSQATQQSYVNYMHALSISQNVPMLDPFTMELNSVSGASSSWGAMNTLGMTGDYYHLTAAGYAWEARYIGNYLLQNVFVKSNVPGVNVQGWEVLNMPNVGGYNSTTIADYTSIGVGAQSLQAQTASSGDNSALGYQSLIAVTTGANNVAIGYQAGDTLTTGTNNVIIGSSSQANNATDTNEIVLGQGLTGGGSNTVNIGGIITATGIGTPSTSTVTVPGNLTVTGTCTGCGGGGTVNLGTSASANNPQRTSQAGTGFYSDTSNDVKVAANSQPVEELLGVSSAVDWVKITNAATANPASVQINPVGSDTNINLSILPAGSGGVTIGTTSQDSSTEVSINAGTKSNGLEIDGAATGGVSLEINSTASGGQKWSFFGVTNGTGIGGAGNLCLSNANGQVPFCYLNGSATNALIDYGVYGWSADGAYESGNLDTGISRDASGVIDFGTGSSGNTGALVQAAGYDSKGTKFTASGCSNSSTVGGATSGQFSSGTTGICTVTVTMNGATGLTAPNGWSCWVNDITTGVAGAQSGSSATTATLKTTTTSGDTVSFGCIGY